MIENLYTEVWWVFKWSCYFNAEYSMILHNQILWLVTFHNAILFFSFFLLRWYIGDWSPCSQTCDEGSKVRQVYCQQQLENGRSEAIEEAYCLGLLGFKPEYQEACTVQQCPHWVAGEWSEVTNIDLLYSVILVVLCW